jgi:DNA repair protein RecN (Recombination protein N)
MLQQLSIRNYAIIDELEIRFHPQFNIITGETGAGKSILMGALGLVLGNRADSSVLYGEGEKCVVEAIFELKSNKKIAALLVENELDEEQQITVRREIAANGKSRSFINDTPVTLNVLRVFAAHLVDLHQQFDSLELGEDDFQRSMVDALAGHADTLKDYRENFNAYTKADRELKRLKEQQQNARKEFDYYSFLFEELEEAAFEENELENLEEELQLLSNAGHIKEVLSGISYSLLESEQPVVQQLKILFQQLQSLRASNASLQSLTERLQAVQVELKDIAGELGHLNDRIHMDGERLQKVSDRIDLGNRLFKKHNVTDTAALLVVKAGIQLQLQNVLHIDESIAASEKAAAVFYNKAFALSKHITKNRRSVTAGFEQKLASLLNQVGMPNALVKITIEPLTELGQHGADEIRFLFDANKSGRFEPIEKVASGGELSRLMLSIKSIVARSMDMPTLIFDEIDTGISGEAARQVGIIMKDLAAHHQVISITHQPQIAARAAAHYFVFKKQTGGLIKTRVRLLNDEERVDTIARMLSGEQISDNALQTAREMVGRA